MKSIVNLGRAAIVVGLLALSRFASETVELLPLIGVVMLGIAAWTWLKTRALLATAWNADGVVIAVTRGRGKDRRSPYIYYSGVRFATITGEVVEFIAGVGRVPRAHKVGDEVTVLYNPRNPNEARIQSMLQLWFFTGLFGVLGTAYTVVGIVILLT